MTLINVPDRTVCQYTGVVANPDDVGAQLLLDALQNHPIKQEWVDQLRELLDLMGDFPDNDQRARFLISSNFMRDHGADMAARVTALDSLLGGGAS